ncbi:MAG: helix-turn-helix domain-containing protein [Acidimicrobiia bacterium]|nr:helix-turn-helix domain-containing protein [Acidimicrobiia bacterium]
MSDKSRIKMPGAVRALDLLEALAAEPDGLSPAELSSVVSGARSTLYTLINTLRERDYIVQDDSRGRYRIGPATWGLVPDQTDMTAALVEAFEQLHDGGPPPETMALVTRAGDGFPVLAENPADHVVRSVYPPGSAHLPAGAAATVLRAGGGSDADHLREVRTEGYASRSTSDVVEIAAPVCADGRQPIAALMIGIPRHRAEDTTIPDFVSLIRSDAARLSHRLGARVYNPYGQATSQPLGPRRLLDESEVSELLEGEWGIQLACVREDGTPHLVPLWYEWDGSSLWVTATPGASWKGYVSSNDMVSLTLDEPWPPLRRVFVRGRAVPVEDGDVPGGLLGLRQRLAHRYLGSSDVDPEEGWRAYRIDPFHIHGVEGLGNSVPGQERAG